MTATPPPPEKNSGCGRAFSAVVYLLEQSRVQGGEVLWSDSSFERTTPALSLAAARTFAADSKDPMLNYTTLDSYLSVFWQCSTAIALLMQYYGTFRTRIFFCTAQRHKREPAHSRWYVRCRFANVQEGSLIARFAIASIIRSYCKLLDMPSNTVLSTAASTIIFPF